MAAETTVMLITALVALVVALLVWFVIDVTSVGMRKYRQAFTERTGFQIQELFLFLDPAKLFIAQLGLMTGGALLAWLASGTLALAAPVFLVLGLAPRLLYGALRNRRLRRFDEQLPDALLMLAGGLKAGLGMSAALAQMVSESQPPLQQEFSLVLREQRLGVAHEKSLAGLAQRVPTQTTILVVSAMRIATETGGGLAEMLERTATTIRSRLQMEGKIRALTSQGKLQAWVVGALPIALMLILNALEPEAMSVLWHTRLGWATLAVVAFLECVGVRLIRKIVAIDV